MKQVCLRRAPLATLLSSASLRVGLRSSSLAVAGNAIGLCLILGLAVFVGSFRENLRQWLDYSLTADVFVSPLAPGDPNHPPVLPAAAVQQILEMRGAKSARYASLSGDFNGVPVTIAGSDFFDGAGFREYRTVAGRLDYEKLRSGEELLISETAARKTGLAVGEQATVLGREMRVAAIYRDFSRERGYLLLDFGQFATLSESNRVESLSIYVSPQDNSSVKASLRKLSAEIPLKIVSNRELKESALRVFEETFTITGLIGIIVAILCAFGLLVSLFQQTWERRADLKTLVYLGCSPLQLRSAVMLEAAQVLVPSLLLGIGGGIILGALLIKVVNPISFGWSLDFHPGVGEIFWPVSLIVGANIAVALLTLVSAERVVGEARVSEE
jgi:putative ABC transport system permease protein